jgi:putative transposase
MPKLRHYDHLNTARFITFSCCRRHTLLTATPVIRAFLAALQAIRLQHQIRIVGYVIMPEHVHLVLHHRTALRLGPVIGELKSKSASRIIAEGLITLPANCRVVKDGRERWIFWQPRCYDHNCRTTQTVVEKINYCHDNPVVRQLVGEPGQWQWSSFNWYAGRSDVPLEMDEFY